MASNKKIRNIPKESFPDLYERDKFDILGSVTIKDKWALLSFSRHLEHDKSAPTYSKADLEYLIAKINKTKEEVSEHCDEVVKMLRTILERDGD